MTDQSSDLVQGTLDMLILKTLALEPMHGYGVAARIEQMSGGVFRVQGGSLFFGCERLSNSGMGKRGMRKTQKSNKGRKYILSNSGARNDDSKKPRRGQRRELTR